VSDYLLDGRYRLTELIASGGMGEVWRGVDVALHRQVAVKLLSGTHAGDESFRARFHAEARYAASLSHPGIARVFDYGESRQLGSAYLIMELVNGEPLSAILDRAGRLSPGVTLDIVAQAARALHAAHQAGIVHRDIKPGNLLVTADGTTKITDFGIATAMQASQAAHLTATGIVMGTAMYVSPEQATGATVTAASDIYSLGIVAYECLAGTPPFVADEPLAIAIAHKHDPVPPLPDDVPPSVADLVMSMLEKTPEARPETARHVADRAGVLRDGMTMSGHSGYSPAAATAGPRTAGMPALPSGDTERTVAPLGGRRRLAAAGMSLALCGAGAIVAVVLASGHHPAMSSVKPPGQEARQAAPPATASIGEIPGAASHGGGRSLEAVTQTTAGPAVRSGHSHKSPAPTVGATPPVRTPTARPSPTASASSSASKSPKPTASATGTTSTNSPKASVNQG